MKIVVEFSGGPLDGQSFEGDSQPSDPLEVFDPARAYFLLTEDGQVGSRFRMLPEDPAATKEELADGAVRSGSLRRRYYQIVERVQHSGGVRLRACFVEGIDPISRK